MVDLQKGLLRRWTIAAIECYQRGCICDGCQYNDFFKSEDQQYQHFRKCQMKKYVIELVRLYGRPKGLCQNAD